MKKQYRIAMFYQGHAEAIEVLGEPVEIPGFEWLPAIAHRDPLNSRYWKVSDEITGCWLGFGLTRKAAVDNSLADLRSQKNLRAFVRRKRAKFYKNFGDLRDLPLATSDKSRGCL